MSPEGAAGEVDLGEFRRAGHALVDWIAEYLAHPEGHRVFPAEARPGAFAAALPPEAPARGEPLGAILEDALARVPPAVTHWNHPGFMAYFAITGSAPGILADLLSSALNVNAMLWRTAPAATELEEATLAWLARALGLPPRFGLIADTASIATFLALVAARDRAAPGVRERGLAGRAELAPLRVYASTEAHSSVDKGVIAAGIGLENLVKVATDAELRMDPEALARAVAEDRRRGLVPCAVVATVGTTSTTSVDPVPAVARVAAAHGLWLHVDAAYAGAAAVVPELRATLAGAEDADSLVVNPHKWLFTPFDLSALWLREPARLREATALVPEYLRTPETGVTNLMDYGLQLGRRFRALKLWFVLRAYGTEGLAARIREHVRIAAGLAARVDAEPDLERLAPVPFSVVCLRARPRELRGREEEPAVGAWLDRLNAAVLERVNASGEVFLSHTKLRGRLALRVAIGNLRTTEAHVRRAEELLLGAARGLARELGPAPASGAGRG